MDIITRMVGIVNYYFLFKVIFLFSAAFWQRFLFFVWPDEDQAVSSAVCSSFCL